MELVEGKARPRELGSQEFDNLGGKTVGLLLRCMKSYFASGRYVILDSGFCVLKGIIELRKRGVFSCALIKKRRYWPTKVPGQQMQDHFDEEGVKVGDTDAIQGTMDGITYNLWGMKEPDYVMRMMATGGALLEDDTCRETTRSWMEDGVRTGTTFKYKFPFDWHFRYRHAVDDHNNLRHALPSLEDSWTTRRWEVRVFSFVLAVCEVNAFLVSRYFVYGNNKDNAPTLLTFRRRLAWQLINNKWLEPDQVEHQMVVVGTRHSFLQAPNHAKEYRNRRWYCTALSKYQQYKCSLGCGRRVRTYCACNPSAWVCQFCHAKHVLAFVREE